MTAYFITKMEQLIKRGICNRDTMEMYKPFDIEGKITELIRTEERYRCVCALITDEKIVKVLTNDLLSKYQCQDILFFLRQEEP